MFHSDVDCLVVASARRSASGLELTKVIAGIGASLIEEG